MLTVTWLEGEGWGTPKIVPYGPLTIMPTASCLHYATQCFEGMKIYRGYDGKLRLFRPDRNCARLVSSSTRVALPAFDPVELEKLLKALMKVDGASMYSKLQFCSWKLILVQSGFQSHSQETFSTFDQLSLVTENNLVYLHRRRSCCSLLLFHGQIYLRVGMELPQ